jgi:hypothetical protein
VLGPVTAAAWLASAAGAALVLWATRRVGSATTAAALRALSLNSMVSMPAAAFGGIVLGALADRAGCGRRRLA